MSKKVYFIAGYSPRKGLFGVASYLHEAEGKDVEFTRFFTAKDGQWFNQEWYEDVVSVSYTRSGDFWSWWLLSKRGSVLRVSSNGRSEEVIPGAGTGPGKPGYLSQIKSIGGDLYACGLNRQVYKRENDSWTSISDQILSEGTKFGFRSIDGVAEDNLHAVGYGGEIWYYSGSSWQRAPSPTNVTLEVVRFIAPDICYVCGKKGTLLRGYMNEWEVVDNQSKEDFWGMEYFKGTLYLSSTERIYKVEQNAVVPLNLSRNVEGRRLYANGEELWSMEHHEIWIFDGDQWREVVCPDNL